MIVIGIKRKAVVDFYDSKKGQQVHLEGAYLYLAEKQPEVEGVACSKPVFISNSKPIYADVQKLQVNDEVNVYYNRFGSIDAVVKA